MRSWPACLAALWVAGLWFCPRALRAALPDTLNYQGRMLLTSGAAVADSSSNNIAFALYTVPTGGTAIWTESQSGVTTAAGLFNVQLGAIASLSGLAWDQPYWLGINFNGNGEMSPRTPLTMAPYAFRAKSLVAPAQVSATVAGGPVLSAQNFGNGAGILGQSGSGPGVEADSASGPDLRLAGTGTVLAAPGLSITVGSYVSFTAGTNLGAAVPDPLDLIGSNPGGAVIKGTNAAATGQGVEGRGLEIGVLGTVNSSTTGVGVLGSVNTSDAGVKAVNTGTGAALIADGYTTGISVTASSLIGTAVYARASSTSKPVVDILQDYVAIGSSPALRVQGSNMGITVSAVGAQSGPVTGLYANAYRNGISPTYGIQAFSESTGDNVYGGYFISKGAPLSNPIYGVFAQALPTFQSQPSYGVYARSLASSSGYGVVAEGGVIGLSATAASVTSGQAVYGRSSSPQSTAFFANDGTGPALVLAGTATLAAAAGLSLTVGSYVSFTAGTNLGGGGAGLPLQGQLSLPGGYLINVTNAASSSAIRGSVLSPGYIPGSPDFNSLLPAGLEGSTSVSGSAGVLGVAHSGTESAGVVGIGADLGIYGHGIGTGKGGNFESDSGTAGSFNGVVGIDSQSSDANGIAVRAKAGSSANSRAVVADSGNGVAVSATSSNGYAGFFQSDSSSNATLHSINGSFSNLPGSVIAIYGQARNSSAAIGVFGYNASVGPTFPSTSAAVYGFTDRVGGAALWGRAQSNGMGVVAEGNLVGLSVTAVGAAGRALLAQASTTVHTAEIVNNGPGEGLYVVRNNPGVGIAAGHFYATGGTGGTGGIALWADSDDGPALKVSHNNDGTNISVQGSGAGDGVIVQGVDRGFSATAYQYGVSATATGTGGVGGWFSAATGVAGISSDALGVGVLASNAMVSAVGVPSTALDIDGGLAINAGRSDPALGRVSITMSGGSGSNPCIQTGSLTLSNNQITPNSFIFLTILQNSLGIPETAKVASQSNGTAKFDVEVMGQGATCGGVASVLVNYLIINSR